MKQHQKLTLILCCIWAASLLYGEMVAFWMPSFSSCFWPHSSASNSTMNGVSSSHDYVRVAVLTDPQLTDRTSLPLPPKSLALELVQFYSDFYLRRAFYESILPLKPDVFIFLGDFFDGGPFLLDDEWQESLHRFKHIFGRNGEGRHASIQAYTIPGNHDIGYASVNSRKPEVIKRYEKEFGARNYRFTVGKVEFIAVDSQTLDGHTQGDLTSITWEFIKNVSKDPQLLPRVLLTHIPLYRPDHTSCGPQRSAPVINQRISLSAHNQEIVYQNYLTEVSSNRLLDLIKPVLILSGHDHDQCTVTHQTEFGPVKEHTVGTVSWQQGNLYPSFLLLSVSNSAKADVLVPEVLMTQLCFLPMQTHIYLWYLMLLGLTLISLLCWPTSGINFGHHFSGLIVRITLYGSMLKGSTKEKIDDNCEYEMIWDAEGSMHLVKKPQRMPVSLPSVRASIERGNAVMRPTAKKNISPGIEFPMNIDTNADAEYDSMTKFPQRTSKSRIKTIIHRLLRTFRMVTVIVAVNLPIYMMLLFKNWVDR